MPLTDPTERFMPNDKTTSRLITKIFTKYTETLYRHVCFLHSFPVPPSVSLVMDLEKKILEEVPSKICNPYK